MTSRFDPRQELIVVSARLVGPVGTLRLSLALDTGASYTLIQPDTLRLIGYQPASSTRVTRIITGSRVESVPVVVVDGVLGLDLIRGSRLTIDFRAGTLDLTWD